MRKSTMSESLINFKLYFCGFYILVIALTGTDSQPQCGLFQAKCQNGECINSEQRCDGKIDCSDSSDETTELCSGLKCPDFAFTCAYGACVRGNAKCNGVKDCADNSDEICDSKITNATLFGTWSYAQTRCGKFQWTCKNGECINNVDRCDGKVTCSDSSDETQELCAGVNCPQFTTKCNYGACVHGNAKCDGVKDCADNSDEENCESSQIPSNKTRGNCSANKFQCLSGEYIGTEQVCDGKQDCKDSSDETKELCSGMVCPAFVYKCNYGACAHVNAKCNGIKDCADNSDEENCGPSQVLDTKKRENSSASLNAVWGSILEGSRSTKRKRNAEMFTRQPNLWCINRGYYADGDVLSGFLNDMCPGVKDCINGSKSDEPCNPLPETRPDPIIPTDLFDVVTTPTVTTTTTPEPDGSSCPAIFDDPNISAVHAYDTSITVGQWEIIDEFREIFYRCRPTFVLYGSKDNHCVKGRWRYPIPKCSKVCSTMEIQGVSFSTKCKFGPSETPCSGLIQPNTRADISCSIGYRKPLRDVPETIVCGETGEWDYHPASCEPDCGKLPVSATPFINGGEPVNITKVPWHTAIYKSGGGGKYDHICGGTIYSAKLVISAAHCFWDVKKDMIEDKGLFTIAAGKVYRSYDASEPLFTQFFNLSEIHIPVSYGGAGRSYENDIAMLVLDNYIVYKDHIKPICIRWFQYAEREVKPGTVGRIAGWGKTNINNEFGEDLKAVDLPAFSKEQCLENDLTYNTYITGEKFCVGAPDDESVCEGDSGGGYIVKNDDTETYYLWGVLSVGLGRTCDRNHLTTFTNIQYHKDMITEYEIRYRPK